MNPCDPSLAPTRCWEHDDCLEHPELALACATELTYMPFEDTLWQRPSGDGSDTATMCRYGFIWRPSAPDRVPIPPGDGGCRASHDGDGDGGGWIDDARRIPYDFSSESSEWGTDEVWPGSSSDSDDLYRQLTNRPFRRGDFLETE